VVQRNSPVEENVWRVVSLLQLTALMEFESSQMVERLEIQLAHCDGSDTRLSSDWCGSPQH
jgi:hypothetical protein